MSIEHFEIQEVREDIREIKVAVKEQAAAYTTLALHSQRLEGLDGRLLKVEKDTHGAWEAIRGIKEVCLKRDPVIEFGRKKDGKSFSSSR